MVRPPYWVGQRLLDLAVNRWPEFHGTVLLRTGHEPLHLPLPSLLDVIYAWWIEGATEKEVTKFRQQLLAPPAGSEPDSSDGWSDEEMDGSFAAAMRATAVSRVQRHHLSGTAERTSPPTS